MRTGDAAGLQALGDAAAGLAGAADDEDRGCRRAVGDRAWRPVSAAVVAGRSMTAQSLLHARSSSRPDDVRWRYCVAWTARGRHRTRSARRCTCCGWTARFYSRAELTAPWGMTLPPMAGHLWFHVVTAGRARLELDGRRAGVAAARATSRSSRTAAATSCAASRGAPAPGILELDLEHSPSATSSSATAAAARRRRSSAAPCASTTRPPRSLVGILPRLARDRGVRRTARALDAQRVPAHGGRGAGVPARRRGGHHAAGRHPRHPGDPRVDRDRPRRADRAGSARCRTARSAARSRSSTATRRGLDGRVAGATSSRCRARRSPRASPSSSASRRCSTSPAGGCTSRSTRSRPRARRWASSPTGSATAPRRRSRGRSSA